MLESDLITCIREDYKMDIAIFDDAELSRLFAKASRKISESFPKKLMSYIETVKDQTRYTVTISDLLRIVEVYYDGIDTSLPYSNLFTSIGSATSFDSRQMSTFAISRNMEFVKRLETIKRMMPVCATIVDYNAFDLIPTPGCNGNRVYFDYETYRTIAEIPQIFEEEMCMLCVFYSTEGEFLKKFTSSSHNNYNFDRRGNTKVGDGEASNQSILRRDRNSFLKDIEKTIRKKVIKLT